VYLQTLAELHHKYSYNQSLKKKIGFIPYMDPDNADEEFRELAYKNIYDAALRGFVNTQRFEVLDRGSFDIIKIEKEFQKGEDLANVEIVKQGNVAAAELLAVAKLTTFTIEDSDDGKGFSVYMTAEFKQIDVETGRATSAFQLRSEVVDKQEGPFGITNKNRIGTEEQAISEAVIQIEEDLERWVKTEFPLILDIIDVQNKEQEIMVNGGRSAGLNEKIDMKVVSVRIYPNGKKSIREICELKYTKDGVGVELTPFKIKSKKDWPVFQEAWQKQKNNLYVTEDI
jgi:hypothetical protein